MLETKNANPAQPSANNVLMELLQDVSAAKTKTIWREPLARILARLAFI